MTVQKFTAKLLGLSAFATVALFSADASANTVRIESPAQRDIAINIETSNMPTTTAAPTGWWSAQWVVEPIAGTNFYRIKNRWKPDLFLNNETRSLQTSPIQEGWWSAQWTFEKSPTGMEDWRICNRWTAECLKRANGALSLGAAGPGDRSAVWTVAGFAQTGSQAKAQTSVAKPPTQWVEVVGKTSFDPPVQPIPIEPAPPPATNSPAYGVKDATAQTALQGLEAFGGAFTTLGSNGYRVSVDYCHSDLEYTNTNNQITVEFWSEIAGRAPVMVGENSRSGIAGCSLLGAPASLDQPFTILNAASPVTHFIIKTDGDDAFFIDEIRLFEGGREVIREGADNGRGWCLSTDPTDNSGAWANSTSACRTQFRFNRK
jgi:hypothetical protein